MPLKKAQNYHKDPPEPIFASYSLLEFIGKGDVFCIL